MKRSSHKVKVMPKFGGHLPGEDESILSQNIGSSFKGSAICRGLNPIEEDKYLPGIIGYSPQDGGYAKQKELFWRNISKKVTGLGVELEVGFIYPSDEAYAKGKKEEEEQANLIELANALGKRHEEIFDVRSSVGEPIEVNDYVLWRYLLVYGDCANNPEDRYKSTRIRLFIIDEKKQLVRKVANIKDKRKAMAVLLSLEEDTSKRKAVVSLMKDRLIAAKKGYSTPAEFEIALDFLVETHPTEFISTANDTGLLKKYFVQQAIDAKLLRRVPNTNIIIYGDNQQIGASLDEAIDWLFAEPNMEILQSIKGQLKLAKK